MTTTRTRMFTYLDGSGHAPEEVGGKAAGLDQLIASGFPVPNAAVLTTVAYRNVATEHSLELLVEDLRGSALPAPDQIAAESAAIERAFLAARLPNDVTAAITRIGREMLRDGPVAVRSSATAEDMRCASFAGQYLTITGVTDGDELQKAVRRCWASLWMPSARAYRRSRNISDHRIAMAVVVQQMVDPQWSGVIFTSDPDGAPHLIRIEAVRGLGEALVSGRVTPDDFVIRKDTLEVVSSSRDEPPDFLEDLGRIAVDLESAGRGPQDIEWAYTDSGLALLQMRPITTGLAAGGRSDDLDTEPGRSAVYTPHGVIEMLPGVVPPLLWTINAPMLENAFRTTLADLGGRTPDRSERIVCRFRGRTALNLSALSEIATSMPGGSAAEVERQYLGRALSEDDPAAGRGSQVLAALRARTIHRHIVDEVELISSAATGLNAIGLDLTVLPVRRLVAYRQRIRDLAWRGYAAEVGASSAASATYRALEVLLARWLPEPEASTWAQRVTSGALAKSAVGAARAKALAEVLDHHAGPEIAELIAAGHDEPRGRIAAVTGGKEFLAALDERVSTMGSRAIYGDVTWAEDDWWIWRQLHLLSKGPRVEAPATDDEFEALCRRLTSQKRWRRLRILTGQFVDVRVRWLQRQVSETIRFLELRERAKSALLVLGGEERRIIVEAAQRLIDSRLLPDSAHVQYLTDAELDGMLFGKRDCTDEDWAARERLARHQAADRPLPDWFTGDPDYDEPPSSADGDRLEGWAASPGVAEGTVRIIKSLAEGTRLDRGDILVAHSTDPSWTGLLLTAGGIVLETGGPLAHAAIVAREFGLPAVLNVSGATRSLHDGELVRVDGTCGSVDIIPSGGGP